jgi:hypothetical protein
MITPALLLLTLSTALAQEEPEDVLLGEPSDVDASPWIEALGDRFLECLADEGTSFDAADAAAVQEAISVMAPALSNAGGSSCTADQDAVSACAASATAQSCESLHGELAAILSGQMSLVEVPTWAESYASAMSGRVASCYAAETGTPLSSDEQADLTLFQSLIGQTLGALTQACSVDEDNVDTCISEAGAMDCADLATYLASEEVDLMVKDFMASCSGALDCGY